MNSNPIRDCLRFISREFHQGRRESICFSEDVGEGKLYILCFEKLFIQNKFLFLVDTNRIKVEQMLNLL